MVDHCSSQYLCELNIIVVLPIFSPIPDKYAEKMISHLYVDFSVRLKISTSPT